MPRRLTAWLLALAALAAVGLALWQRYGAELSALRETLLIELAAVLLGSWALFLCALAYALSSSARAAGAQRTLWVQESERAKRLEQSDRLVNSLLASMDDGVMVLDSERRLLVINASAQRFVAQREGEQVPQDWAEAPLTRALQGEATENIELRMRDEDDELRTVSINARPLCNGDTIVGCVAVLHDLSERRRFERELHESEERQRALSHASFNGLALTVSNVEARGSAREQNEQQRKAQEGPGLSLRDGLTGLYGRPVFCEVAEHALRTLARGNLPGCLFYADLNSLKAINENLGHETGDRVIAATGTLLAGVFRESDIVARLGGDQFAVLALECGLADIPSVLERIEARVAELNRREAGYAVSLSVGTALFEPPATVDLKAMMDNADQAMNEQKRLAKQRRTA